MKKINSLQYSLIVVFPMLSSILGTGSYVAFKTSSISTPLSAFIAILLGFIYLLSLLYIINFDKEKNLSEIVEIVFGRLFGKIINFTLISISLIIAITYFYSTSLFLSTQLLQRTPIFVISCLLILIIYITTSKGYQNLTRVAEIILIINIILFIIPCIDLAPQIKIDNFKPFINHNISNILKSSVIIFSLSILPIYLIFSHQKNVVNDSKNFNKFIILYYFVGSLLIFSLFIFTIGPLGEYLIGIYRYPDYIVTQKVSFFNFIDRIENLITMQWVLGSTIYVSIIIIYINNSLCKNKSINKPLVFIISILILIISNQYFKNNFIYNYYIIHIFPYICLIVLPIILICFILIFIKKRKFISK